MTKANLSARFTLILSGIFLVGIAIGGTAYWRTLQIRAQQETTAQGLLLIEGANAVRSYTSQNVRPQLIDLQASTPDFIRETVPSFSARTVFQNFRSEKDFEPYEYKEAAISPTNPLDRADEFEAALLKDLAAGNEVETSGYTDVNGSRMFYIARPLRIGAESCLDCHSTPDKAPTSLLATYGDKGGFGWSLGQVVAVQIIYVPSEEIFRNAFRTFVLVMAIYIVIFAAMIFLINVLLRRYVIQPLELLGGLAQKISEDENYSTELQSPALEAVTVRTDELGHLAHVFRRMAADVQARTVKLKEQIQQLIIKIDETRRQEQVSEVVDSKFFTDLKKRAGELRKRGTEGEESETKE